jgi:hypothetical protein
MVEPVPCFHKGLMKVSCSPGQVAALGAPGMLVEIDVIAAGAPPASAQR